jgi:hypothetical protein
MPDTDPDCPPLVSVQLGAAPDLVAGHLSWGVLLDEASLIAAPPLGWTTGNDPVFVLLASAQDDGTRFVERIGLRRVEVLGTSDDLDSCVAYARLANTPRHRGADGSRPSERIQRALARSDDMWTALEQLRVIPTRLRELDPEAVLRPVVDWETRFREELVAPRVLRNDDEIVFRWCKLFGGCQCTDQWW